MVWQKNNRAHHWTWKAMRGTDLIRSSVSFEKAGVLRIDQLRHWVGSSTNRRTRAATLAEQFDALFVKVLGATYETDQGTKAKKRDAARAAIANVLQNGSAKVDRLGDTCDAEYHFPME